MKQQSEKAENRRKKEQRVVEEMILLYCKKNHRKKEGVCEECARLLEYAKLRSQNCPLWKQKHFAATVRSTVTVPR